MSTSSVVRVARDTLVLVDLSDHTKVLSKGKTFRVVFRTDDRLEALEIEKEVYLKYRVKGFVMLNGRVPGNPGTLFPETLAKIAEKKIGVPHPEGTGEKISASLKEYWSQLTPEQRKRANARQVGQKRSEETKRKIAEAMKGNRCAIGGVNVSSEELRALRRERMLGNKFAVGNTNMRGYKMTEENRRAIRDGIRRAREAKLTAEQRLDFRGLPEEVETV